MEDYSVKIRVVELNGFCPVFRLGDEFVISAGYVLEGRERYCMHALSSLLPYYVALSRGIAPSTLGLCKEGENVAYIQCPDPQKHSGGGGTVVFELSSMKGSSDGSGQGESA
jgi:uncharacterized repeat protein (TIGR04076 family)